MVVYGIWIYGMPAHIYTRLALRSFSFFLGMSCSWHACLAIYWALLLEPVELMPF